MPWDTGGYPIEDFTSGYRCGYCGSIGECSHGQSGRPDEAEFDEYPASECVDCGVTGKLTEQK